MAPSAVSVIATPSVASRSRISSARAKFRSPREVHPPLVVLADISGSMSQYTRIFLHFLHALTEKRRRVQPFVFGTRLTNITRHPRARDVDAALNSEKLLEQGIVVDFPLVRDLTLGKVKFDKALINKVKTVKDHGGNVKSYFETLSVNKGSDSTEKNDELAMQDFNNLSNRLIQTIDQIIGNEELVDEVDTKTLLDLLAKLEALRKVTGSCLLYTSPSPRDRTRSRMPSSA